MCARPLLQLKRERERERENRHGASKKMLLIGPFWFHIFLPHWHTLSCLPPALLLCSVRRCSRGWLQPAALLPPGCAEILLLPAHRAWHALVLSAARATQASTFVCKEVRSTCFKCDPPVNNGYPTCNSASHVQHYCADSPAYVKPTPPPPPPPRTTKKKPTKTTTTVTTTLPPPPSCALQGAEIQITIPPQDLDARTGGTSGESSDPRRGPKAAFDGITGYGPFSSIWIGHKADALGYAHTKSQHNYLTVDLGMTMVLTKLKFFPEPGDGSPSAKHYERM